MQCDQEAKGRRCGRAAARDLGAGNKGSDEVAMGDGKADDQLKYLKSPPAGWG